MTTETEKLRIHFIYSVAILLSLLILVATDRWTNEPNFTAYLTNAATMTSLVLALVAIIYSFIANDGLSKSLGNISIVSEDVKQSKEQISKYLDLTTSSAELARDNANAMHAFSSDVNSTLQALDTALKAVASRTDALSGAITAIPTRLDQLENNVMVAAKLFGEKAQVPPRTGALEGIGTEAAQQFLEVSSLTANLLSYACVLANKTSKILSIEAFCEAADSNIPQWFSGYLTCMHAADLITVDRIKNARYREFTVTMVHPVLEQRAKSYFVDYVKRTFRDQKDQSDTWLARLTKVEHLFE
ncbi:MAG: hypothetical protein KGL36_03015 [Gammaproteobacteria bacterium]|nr:hypothetical protein [Gammaproteobacteria bacterium]